MKRLLLMVVLCLCAVSAFARKPCPCPDGQCPTEQPTQLSYRLPWMNQEEFTIPEMAEEPTAVAAVEATAGVKFAATGQLATSLLVFTQNDCPPCEVAAPLVQNLIRAHRTVNLVDTRQRPDLVRFFRVRQTPTFVMLAEGKEVGRIEGVPKTEAELANLYVKGQPEAKLLAPKPPTAVPVKPAVAETKPLALKPASVAPARPTVAIPPPPAPPKHLAEPVAAKPTVAKPTAKPVDLPLPPSTLAVNLPKPVKPKAIEAKVEVKAVAQPQPTRALKLDQETLDLLHQIANNTTPSEEAEPTAGLVEQGLTYLDTINSTWLLYGLLGCIGVVGAAFSARQKSVRSLVGSILLGLLVYGLAERYTEAAGIQSGTKPYVVCVVETRQLSRAQQDVIQAKTVWDYIEKAGGQYRVLDKDVKDETGKRVPPDLAPIITAAVKTGLPAVVICNADRKQLYCGKVPTTESEYLNLLNRY